MRCLGSFPARGLQSRRRAEVDIRNDRIMIRPRIRPRVRRPDQNARCFCGAPCHEHMVQQRSRKALLQRVGVREDTFLKRWFRDPGEERVFKLMVLQELLEHPHGALLQAVRGVERWCRHHVQVAHYDELVLLSLVLACYLRHPVQPLLLTPTCLRRSGGPWDTVHAEN